MSLRSSCYDHRYMLSVCAVYAALVFMILVLNDMLSLRVAGIVLLFLFYRIFYVPVLIMVCFAQACIYDSRDKNGRWLGPKQIIERTEARWSAFTKSKLCHDGVIALTAITFLMVAFCFMKSMFPILAHSNFDTYWSSIDLRLHGGYPHDYMMPLIQRFHAERLLEYVYLAWFPVMMTVGTYNLFYDRDVVRRKQYLWTFIFCWIVSGTVLALSLYSMGPVFYHLVNPGLPNPYGNLIVWLSSVADGKHAFTFDAAMYLYETSMDNIKPDLNAPSAMPSQHVAVTWLMALYAFRHNKTLGTLMSLYTVSIFIASVTLGWHYAVDGYAGIFAVTVLWFIAGAVLRKSERNVEA